MTLVIQIYRTIRHLPQKYLNKIHSDTKPVYLPQ